MENKKRLKLLFSIFLTIIILYSFLFLANECSLVYRANYCSIGYIFGMSFEIFILNILYILFAILFWFISPIGILFLLGARLFFSEKSSRIRKKFALLLQLLSFLSWFSLMFVLLIVYIDSVSYKVLNLGGYILNLAIESGFVFVIFMIILAVLEKKMIFKQKYNSRKRNDKINNKEKNIKVNDSSSSGIKSRVKRKIKESVKKILNDEIDRL